MSMLRGSVSVSVQYMGRFGLWTGTVWVWYVPNVAWDGRSGPVYGRPWSGQAWCTGAQGAKVLTVLRC